MLTLSLLLLFSQSFTLSPTMASQQVNTKDLNQLLHKGNQVIENTMLTARPNGMRLPFYSLNWPTPRLGFESFGEYPGNGKGIFLKGEKGTGVVAPASGIVKYVGSMGKHSSVVIVDHRQHLKTIFIGLDKNSVRTGQNVYSGQRFATLPSYGEAVQSYFMELRFKGKPIDPLPFLKRRG